MHTFSKGVPRLAWTLCTIALAIGLAASALGSTRVAELQQQTAVAQSPLGFGSQHWFVDAGAGGLGDALSALDFYSHEITIDAGDSVTWTARGNGHTVSFLAPGQRPPRGPRAGVPAGGHTEDGSAFTSSGGLEPGASYTLSFPKPGIYNYYCLFHQPEMMGKVVVQKAGAPYPHTQAYYYASVVPDIQFDLGQAAKSLAQFPFKEQTTLAAGITPGLYAARPSQSTVLRFLDRFDSSRVYIKVGITLTWVNESNNEPHTVTFPPAGQPLPRIPPFAPRSGGSSYDGTQLTNSGVLLPGQRYSLKFTKAGTFSYACLFHFPEGMTGTITVIP
ncbi:MAG: plastocyanin/azurin family copper-binding protein [Candidatus Eremiobacteraeota bacterium]|nr:plastocyanin/azurin family copper-binding protein [Candidatus Eremiobacteraeota bacterium]